MSRKPQPASLDGILVIAKPRGKTSHDVVESVRRLAGFRQIGHLGTLDPLATGVLVLALGRATRLARFYAGRRKRYTCAIRFGFATDTYDADGEALGPDTAPTLDATQLAAMAAEFIGRIQQTPPAYSAKKIHGKAAHELARKNKAVNLKPADVDVYEFKLTGIEGSVARFVVECGPGTYIRSLADDLGKRHGAGAHLAEIDRTASGEFTIDRAVTLEELAEEARAGKLAERVIRLENMLADLPQTAVLPIVERQIRNGAKFNVSVAQIKPGRVTAAQDAPESLDSGGWRPGWLRVFGEGGQLIAIAEPIVPRTYRPIVVLETGA
jgi:tRNA pseudouridine55 synthase